jgi:FkbM family methyltransferase
MGIEPIFDAAPFGAHVPHGALARYIAGARGAGASWFGRGRAALMRRAGLRAIGAQPVDCEAFGVKLRLYPQNNLTDKRLLFTPEKFDARERAFLAENMREDLIFLDIGANIGAYSLFVAAQAGPRARILAVEPQPDIHARLVYNIRQNGFSCVKTLECALSDCEGEATLFVDARNRGESSLRLVPTTPGARIQVRAQTLEHIVAQEALARIDVLKLDCEGAEDLVLEPFLRRAPLSLFPKILLMERNPACWCVDLFALARAAGYREVLRTDQNIAYELADPQRPD